MSNKKTISLITLITLMLLGLIINLEYNLNNPTEFNKIIVLKKNAPANNAFDDQNFYNCVIDAYNKENSASLPYTTNLKVEQLNTIKSIVCNKSNIESTNGLELVTNLTFLNVSNNNLKNIDVNKNTNLTNLYLSSNNLDNIDVHNNLNLEKIDVTGNDLSTIDVTKNINLKELYLSTNNLENIDISQNTNLENFRISNNKIKDLDLSNNSKLTQLYVNKNNIISLDVSRNSKLVNLYAEENKIINVNVSNNPNLININLSNNNLELINLNNIKWLSTLNVSYNKLTELNLNNNNLRELILSDNEFTSIDLTKNLNLIKLDISNNKLINLDLNKNSLLEELYVYNNEITNLNVDNNTKLKYLSIYNNKLTYLNVSNNLELEYLYAYNNYISSIDTSNNKKLKELSVQPYPSSGNFDDSFFYKCVVDAYNNENNENLTYTSDLSIEQLSTINHMYCNSENINTKIISTKGLELLTGLTELNIGNNSITDLDISKNTKLKTLYADSNNITNIDVTNNINLDTLDLSYNKLTDLDISKNTLITQLNVENNNLTTLKLNNNLKYLDAYENNINALDLSNNLNLEYLNIYSNNIESLDIGNNSKLVDLDVSNNNLMSLDISKNNKLETVSVAGNKLKNLNVGSYSKDLVLSLKDNDDVKVTFNSNYIKAIAKDNDNLISSFENNNKITINSYTSIGSLSLNTPNIEKIEIDGTATKKGNITKLNLENCTNLKKLSVKYNEIDELDLSKNTKLEQLFLSNNNLKGLNLTNNPILNYINLTNNNISSLILGAINNNSELYISNNNKINLTINSNYLTNASTSYDKLKLIYGKNTLKLNSIYDLSQITFNSPNIETIELDGTSEKTGNIKKIVVDKCTNLTKLSVKYNDVKEINLTNNSNLSYVDLSNNDISSLILGGFSNDLNINILNNSKMNLSVNSNYLISTSKDNDNLVLNYSKNIVKLNELSKIEKINFNTPNLEKIELDGTSEKQGNIKKLFVDKSTSLKKLSVKYNKIEEIDLSKNTKLEQLFLSNNNLNSINVENNTELTYLNIINNNLNSLDISKNNKIKTLYIGNNNYIKEINATLSDSVDFSQIDYEEIKLNNNFKKTYKSVYYNGKKIEDKIEDLKSGSNTYDVHYAMDSSNDVVVKLKVNVQGITSEKYIIKNNNIIVTNDDSIEEVYNNVKEPEGYTKKLEENKINIYKEDKLIQGYNIIRIKTKKYEIDYKEETIKVDSDEDNEILNNIEVENAEKVIENNYLIIRKENKNLIKFKLYGIETKYKVNYSNNTIYIGKETNIEDNIKTRNTSISIEDNVLKLKDGEKEIYSLKILSISTKEYIVGEGYIYIGTEKLDLNEIETELNKEEKGNKIELTYEGEVIDTLEIISLKTNEYEIGKNYIYSENNTINTKEIECTNCTMSINNNILEIYNKEKIVKRLERIYVDFKEIKVSKNYIMITEEMTYETLKNNVVLNGVNIKIYDEEDKEITSGEIKEGYTLKVISEKYGEIKEYIFTKEYIDITELEIEEEKYITKFNIGVTNKEIIEKIKTTGSVKIEDKAGKIVSENDIIKTGTKVVIEIGKEKQEYTIVVKGDVTGNGQIAMPDVMKTVNYMLNDNNNEDEECYKKAADVTSDGKILMNDVMKIVNYMFEGSAVN